MYDEVIDTLAFDSVDLALRIMILECANSREHCKNNVTDKILKISWQKFGSSPVMTSVISYFVPVCLKLGDF